MIKLEWRPIRCRIGSRCLYATLRIGIKIISDILEIINLYATTETKHNYWGLGCYSA